MTGPMRSVHGFNRRDRADVMRVTQHSLIALSLWTHFVFLVLMEDITFLEIVERVQNGDYSPQEENAARLAPLLLHFCLLSSLEVISLWVAQTFNILCLTLRGNFLNVWEMGQHIFLGSYSSSMTALQNK